MRLRPLPLVALAVIAAALLGAPASANTTLKLTGFNKMLVGAGHVFVTGGSSDSSIAVLNPDGTLDKMISGESGAGGMVLSGSTLYVARCDGSNQIDEISTDSLTRVGSFTAHVGDTCDLALAGGRLWYSDSTGELESVSLDSSHTEIDSGLSFYEPIFATTAANPNWLVIGETGLSPATIAVEDVTDPSNPSQLASVWNPGGAGNLSDMTISPDGSTLLTASGAPYEMETFSLPTLTTSALYPTDPYPNSVAVSPSGDEVAAGSKAFYDKDVFLFHAGNSTAARTWDFNSTTVLLYPRGLAFSADGRVLYAATASASGAPVVRVLQLMPVGSLTIRASRTATTNGKTVTLTAHLGTSSTNKTVSIYRKGAAAASTVLVHTGKVGAGGNFSYAVKPKLDTVYTVRWSGDATHAPTTSAAVRVNVHPVMHRQTVGGYRTAAGVRLYHFTARCESAAHTGCPEFVAWPGPVTPGRTIKFVVQGRRTNGTWVKVAGGSFPSNAGGKLKLRIFYTSKALVGVPQRIQFSVAKTSSSLGATSTWLPFRVTT
ncbi:MAG TPA: WD40 repeat domain-containing protein [Gaiellales bacterium]|nr:WD40 repeat domain-containing protein [Gaiellales bacterium]